MSLTKIRSWQETHKEFDEACRSGRQMAAERIEDSVYQLAVGAEREVVKPIKLNGRVELVRYRERLPPDLRAATSSCRIIARTNGTRILAMNCPTKKTH